MASAWLNGHVDHSTQYDISDLVPHFHVLEEQLTTKLTKICDYTDLQDASPDKTAKDLTRKLVQGEVLPDDVIPVQDVIVLLVGLHKNAVQDKKLFNVAIDWCLADITNEHVKNAWSSKLHSAYFKTFRVSLPEECYSRRPKRPNVKKGHACTELSI